MKPLVIYHKNCLDGFGAAFAAWLKLGDKAEYKAFNYGDLLPLESISGREVYVLDFSFARPAMNILFAEAAKVIWLDHHKTAFEEYLGSYEKGMEFKDTPLHNGSCDVIILDDNKSGCILAWEYFHPGKEVPEMLAYIDDRDRWQWKHALTKYFTAGLSEMVQDFEVWQDLLEPENVQEVINKGSTITHYYSVQLERSIEATKETCTLPGPDGFPIIGLCANLPPMFASEAGNILAKESGTFGATWFKAADGSVKWSLRSIGDFDVSAIAKSFGGGGHKNAAGFVIKNESLGATPGVKLWLT